MDVNTKKKNRGSLSVDKAQLKKRKQSSVAHLNNKRHKTGVLNCCSGKAVLYNYKNFKNSAIPARLMYFCKGEWIDYEPKAAGLLREAFIEGKTAVEITVGGVSCLVDFLRMSQIDLSNGSQRSFAWIDVAGKCFFPQLSCEAQNEVDTPSIDVKIDLRIDGPECAGTEKYGLVGNSVHRSGRGPRNLSGKTASSDFGSENDSSSAGRCSAFDNTVSECRSGVRATESRASTPRSNSPGFGPSGGNSFKLEEVDQCTGGVRVSESGICTAKSSPRFSLPAHSLIKLEEGDRNFVAVRSRFMAGLGTFMTSVRVVGVYRNSHSSVSGQARLEAFRRRVDDMSRRPDGNNANLKYAWLGTSVNAVAGIILHGFGQPDMPKNRAAYDNSVYLAPEDCSYISAAYSDIDENGEQHAVLCQVIMGNIEQVSPGSRQLHPSSEQFDTGVDDLKNPKRYIVWSTLMNTHILPEFVVSFKVAPHLREHWSALKAKQGATGVQGNLCFLQDGHSGPPRSAIEMGVKQPRAVPVKEEQHKVRGPVQLPSSPWLTFSKLFSVLVKILPSFSITSMENIYSDYKEGKIGRDDLVRKVRLIAGDEVLIEAIKIFRDQVPPNLEERMNALLRK